MLIDTTILRISEALVSFAALLIGAGFLLDRRAKELTLREIGESCILTGMAVSAFGVVLLALVFEFI